MNLDIKDIKMNLKPGELDNTSPTRFNLSPGDMVRVNRQLMLPTNEGFIVDIQAGDVGIVESPTDRGAYVLLPRAGAKMWLWDIFLEPLNT
jgi:hypothetical protein